MISESLKLTLTC